MGSSIYFFFTTIEKLFILEYILGLQTFLILRPPPTITCTHVPDQNLSACGRVGAPMRVLIWYVGQVQMPNLAAHPHPTHPIPRTMVAVRPYVQCVHAC